MFEILPQIPLQFESSLKPWKLKIKEVNSTASLITFYPTIKFTLGSQYSLTLIEVLSRPTGFIHLPNRWYGLKLTLDYL